MLVNLESIKIDEIIGYCVNVLEPRFLRESKNQALFIISQIANIPYMKLLLPDNRITLDKVTSEKIYAAVQMRAAGIPLQYITGKAYFMNEEYMVGKGVLIPRKETEILVEEAFRIINETNIQNILELCTGSGCIIISLLKMMDIYGKSYKAAATDISEEAISYAKRNINFLKPENPIEIIKHDIINEDISRIKNHCDKYEIIISNPPYIKTDEIKNLDPQVYLYEPFEALNGGIDGLVFYNRIAMLSFELLANGGYLLLEIGYDQYDEVSEILHNTGIFEKISVKKDYSGNHRVITARRFSL